MSIGLLNIAMNYIGRYWVIYYYSGCIDYVQMALVVR